MRQLHLALFVAHREIIPGAVVEIANAGEAHAVAVDECPRHHRDFRPPGTIVRGTDGDPPGDHAEKQRDRDHGHAPLTRQPERPDRERRKGDRQRQAQPGRRQIRIIDGKGGPRDEHGPAQKPDRCDQPPERPGQESPEPNSTSPPTRFPVATHLLSVFL